MTQGQMFPMSAEERIAVLRSNLAGDVEKRLAKRDAAAVALADAQDAEDGARGLLGVFDSLVAERAAQRGKSVMQVAADIVNSGALDTNGVTVTASVTPAVDPITGEVTSKDRFSDPPAGKIGTRCPDCDGDGRIPDKAGGGHHGSCLTCQGSGSIQPAPAVSCDTCGGDCNLRQLEALGHPGCGGGSWEPRKPEVLVAWPDNLDMQRIEVGPLTRYGELAAKFLHSLPGDDPRREDSFLDYRIVGVDDVDDADDVSGERYPHAVIDSADYGLEFSVEPAAKAEESAS